MKKQTCKNCKYYYKWKKGKFYNKDGMCRRFPPAEANLPRYWFQPFVDEYDWCGEYKSKGSK